MRRRIFVAGAVAFLSARLDVVGASSPVELDSVFTAMARQRPDAVLVQPSQTNFSHRAQIAQLAIKRPLPTVGWNAETVEAGCLMPYGPNAFSLYGRAAYFVDKILKGAKPADLPSSSRRNVNSSSIAKPRRPSASRSRRRCYCGRIR